MHWTVSSRIIKNKSGIRFSEIRLFTEVVISTKANNTAGEKYNRILEAAVSVFAEKGFHQATISQIAREAGVADGTIYLYFKNKDDILVQFFTYKTKLVFAGFREEVKKADNSISKLRNLVHRHLEEFQKDRNMAVVYEAMTHQNIHLVDENIREMSKMYLDIVSEIIERGQEEGVMRRDLYIGLVKRFILGAVESAISNWLRSKRKYDLTSMTDPIIDLFIRGIGNSGDMKT
ncbi:MAG: TetR/AcrR family transcriptional regulator [Desulfobacterales bacterium]